MTPEKTNKKQRSYDKKVNQFTIAKKKEATVIELSQIKKDSDVLHIFNRAETIEKTINRLEIETDQDYLSANEHLGIISKYKKGLEEKRNFFVGPLNKQVKEINSLFKEYSDPLNRADRMLRDKVLDYKREEERKAKEAEKKAQEAIKKARKTWDVPTEVEIKTKVERPAKTVKTSEGQVTSKKIPDFEIVDEDLIPREYMIPNLARIRKLVEGGRKNIPGIRIFERDSLAVK